MADSQRVEKLNNKKHLNSITGSNLGDTWKNITSDLLAKAKLNIDTDATHSFPDVSNFKLVGCTAYYYKSKRLNTNSEIEILGSADLHVENRIATLSGESFSVITSAGETLVSHGEFQDQTRANQDVTDIGIAESQFVKAR